MARYSYDHKFFTYLQNLERRWNAKPLNLGGGARGTGSPPGGFIGYLPQTRVSFDELELEDNTIPSGVTAPSGMNLVTNLNRIRYRIKELEDGGGGGSGSISIHEDDVLIASGITIINFEGDVSVTDDGGNQVTVDITASGGGASDGKVKVTSNDTTADYLYNKLTAGDGIILTEVDNGGDESILVTCTASGGGGSVSWDGSFWTPLAKPNSPSAYDDEFDDESLNVSWSEYNVGSVEEKEYGIELGELGTVSGYGIFKTSPSSDYTVFTRMFFEVETQPDNSYPFYCGILIGNCLDTPVADDYYRVYGLKIIGDTDYNIIATTCGAQIHYYDDEGSIYEEYDSETLPYPFVVNGVYTSIYLRLKVIVDGGDSTAYLAFSTDGVTYHAVQNAGNDYFSDEPSQIGLGVFCDEVGNMPKLIYSYFRIVNSIAENLDPSGNRIYYKLK